MIPLVSSVGYGVCTLTQKTVGYTSSCVGPDNLGLIGMLTIFGTMVIVGGYVLIHRV